MGLSTGGQDDLREVFGSDHYVTRAESRVDATRTGQVFDAIGLPE
jgi:hypothetical protein